MNRQKAKKDIFKYLSQDSPEINWQKLLIYPQHLLINALFIALCHHHERVRWNAIYFFGRVVPSIAEDDLEAARIIMRRFLWSLNDESGGIGWGAPESMAEIMCHSNILRQEYLHMLISYMREDGEEAYQDGNYLEHPMLQRGLLWGIGRMCSKYPMEMLKHQVDDDLIAYLESSDLYLGGLALWCLGLLDSKLPKHLVEQFVATDLTLAIFLNNEIQSLKISELAKKVAE